LPTRGRRASKGYFLWETHGEITSSSLFPPRHFTNHLLQPPTWLPSVNILQSVQTFALVASCIHRGFGIDCFLNLNPQHHTLYYLVGKLQRLLILAALVTSMASFVSTGSPKLGQKASPGFVILEQNDDCNLHATNELAVRLNTPNRQATPCH
jgi:hypothetical protein